MNRAIFFDRDGVINPLVPRADGRTTSPWTPQEFTLLPRVRDAMRLVVSTYQCFVVTNQPHVGIEMSEQQLTDIHFLLRMQVPEIRDIAYCSVQGSSHYKPNHGMVLELLHKYQLGLPRYHYMVGDRWKDVVCGHSAGVQTIFVGTKYDDGGSGITPNYIVPDIYAACALIMENYYAESRTDRSK